MLDAAIVGAGPAGVAAALSLRGLVPSASIAIFDGSDGEPWRPGETLAPGAMPILESLGCRPAFEDCRFLESFGTRAAWGSAEPHENDFLFGLRGSGWRLDRVRFDEMLRGCAEAAGIAIHRRRFRCGEWDARFTIDATGRAARFAVDRGARHVTDDRLAGVFVLFENRDDGDTLIEAQETGWWYSTTVPGSRSVVAFMTDTDLIRESGLSDPERWQDLLAASTLTRQRMRAATPAGAPAIFAAHSQRLSAMGGPRWVAAGDAATAFDPLSSQGIVKALRSGKLASFVAADFLTRGIDSHDRYERIVRAEYDAYLQTRLEYYRLERRWTDSPFWKRR
jgi:flavin-dependent dehydrogenase